MRLFTCFGVPSQHVSFQVGLGLEKLSTSFACKGGFAVYFHVMLQMEMALERFLTFVALIVSFTLVNYRMNLQGVDGFETFSTVANKVSHL